MEKHTSPLGATKERISFPLVPHQLSLHFGAVTLVRAAGERESLPRGHRSEERQSCSLGGGALLRGSAEGGPWCEAASRGARERQAGKTGGSHTPPAVQRRCMCSVRPAAVGVELVRIEGQVGHGALCCWVISQEMAVELFSRQLETQV